MRDFPVVAKLVINIVLYIVYVLLAWVAFSFIFPLVSQMFGQGVVDPNENMEFFDKIAIFIAILILLISLVLRKYFYISLKSEEIIEIKETKTSYTAKKKAAPKQEKISKKEEEEDIKIYLDKEIK